MQVSDNQYVRALVASGKKTTKWISFGRRMVDRLKRITKVDSDGNGNQGKRDGVQV